MEIKVFTNSDFGEVRIAVNKNKEVLFCLSDVCRALDLTNPSMVKGRLDEAGLSQIEVCSTSVNQYGAKSVRTTNMTYIGEANLYRCIFQSLRIYPPPKIGTLSCHFSSLVRLMRIISSSPHYTLFPMRCKIPNLHGILKLRMGTLR